MRIIEIIKSHKVAVILAILVGLVSVAPQLYVLKDHNYRGIQMFGTDAEYFYVGEVNGALYEDYSKGLFPTDPGKNYYLAPKLGQRIMAFFAKIFNARAIEINVALKFVGPGLLFLILYGWLLEMFSLKTVALLAPLFVILGLNLLAPANLLDLSSLRTNIDTFLPYTRPISPLISSVFLFLSLWGIYRLVSSKSTLKAAIWLGILSGLSLYSYIYTWTFIVVVLGLYFLHFLTKRNWGKVKYLAYTLFINGIVALPFFINLLRAKLDADYAYTTTRIGLIYTHAPIFGIWIVVGFLAIIFLWPKAYPSTKYFFLILFGSLIVALNQQIITGVRIQPSHYHWFTTKPLVAIIVSFLGLYYMGKIISNKKLRMVTLVSIGSILFLNSIVIQANSYSSNYPAYQENQKYVPLFSFLDSTYPQVKNIWASPDLDLAYPELSYLVLAYTRHNAPMVLDNYSNSQEHTQDMFFLSYRLKGVSSTNIANVLNQDRNYIASALSGVYYRDLPGNHQLPDAELHKLALGYDTFYRTPLNQVFKNMNIDLVIEDKKNNDLHLEKIPFLYVVYENNGLFVYQFKSK